MLVLFIIFIIILFFIVSRRRGEKYVIRDIKRLEEKESELWKEESELEKGEKTRLQKDMQDLKAENTAIVHGNIEQAAKLATSNLQDLKEEVKEKKKAAKDANKLLKDKGKEIDEQKKLIAEAKKKGENIAAYEQNLNTLEKEYLELKRRAQLVEGELYDAKKRSKDAAKNASKLSGLAKDEAEGKGISERKLKKVCETTVKDGKLIADENEKEKILEGENKRLAAALSTGEQTEGTSMKYAEKQYATGKAIKKEEKHALKNLSKVHRECHKIMKGTAKLIKDNASPALAATGEGERKAFEEKIAHEVAVMERISENMKNSMKLLEGTEHIYQQFNEEGMIAGFIHFFLEVELPWVEESVLSLDIKNKEHLDKEFKKLKKRLAKALEEIVAALRETGAEIELTINENKTGGSVRMKHGGLSSHGSVEALTKEEEKKVLKRTLANVEKGIEKATNELAQEIGTEPGVKPETITKEVEEEMKTGKLPASQIKRDEAEAERFAHESFIRGQIREIERDKDMYLGRTTEEELNAYIERLRKTKNREEYSIVFNEFYDKLGVPSYESISKRQALEREKYQLEKERDEREADMENRRKEREQARKTFERQKAEAAET